MSEFKHVGDCDCVVDVIAGKLTYRDRACDGYQAGLAEGIAIGRVAERGEVVAWLAENAKENRDTSLAAAGICLKHGEHVRKGDDHG